MHNKYDEILCILVNVSKKSQCYNAIAYSKCKRLRNFLKFSSKFITHNLIKERVKNEKFFQNAN